ncbi:plastidic glucose transporter 4, partial [Tanacetum coccineum]
MSSMQGRTSSVPVLIHAHQCSDRTGSLNLGNKRITSVLSRERIMESYIMKYIKEGPFQIGKRSQMLLLEGAGGCCFNKGYTKDISASQSLTDGPKTFGKGEDDSGSYIRKKVAEMEMIKAKDMTVLAGCVGEERTIRWNDRLVRVYYFTLVQGADPYEAVVLLLLVAIREWLLQILRLGIATRYDIAVESLTNLAQLPESNAILVLDQFMLSGAEERDKGAYLTSLISKALQGGQTRIRSTTFGYVKIKRVHDSGLFTADYSFALSIVFVLSVFRWKHLTGFIDLLDSGGRKVTGLDTKYTDTSMLLLSLSLTWKVLASFSRPLAVIRTVLYVLSFSLGAGPVLALLLPEIFASRIIAKAVALSLYMHWVRWELNKYQLSGEKFKLDSFCMLSLLWSMDD